LPRSGKKKNGFAALDDDDDDDDNDGFRPLDSQMQGQMDHSSALIEERDEAMKEITQKAVAVKEIFQDLAEIVDEQGKDIGTD
jgi:hypothetical protein